MLAFKPYPKYKDSGAEWLGKVPNEWEIKNLGHILVERKETNKSGSVTEILSVTKNRGVIPYSEKGNIGNKHSDDTTRYKVVYPNDIVVNCMNVIIGSVGISKYTGCLSPVYYVLKPRSVGDNPAYLNAYFQTKPFQESLVRIGNGIMSHRMRIPMEKLKLEPFPVPPSEHQTLIVKYLSFSTNKIQQYVEAKLKLIKLLNEQKLIIIYQAVTGAINTLTGKPYPKYKNANIEWLNKVPNEWEIRRIKQFTKILRGKFSFRPRNDPSLYDGAYPFIQTGDVARAKKTIRNYKQTLNERGLSVSKMFPSGTLVMTIAANIGDVAVLDFEACFPDSIVGFVPNSNVERDYLYYLFSAMKQEFLKDAPINTQGNLNIERIGAKKIAIPSFEEQTRIINYIESEVETIEVAIEKAKDELSLLKEYRNRLTFDVVTGKIDIRELARDLPDSNEFFVDDTSEDPAEEFINEDLDGSDEGSEE